MLANLKAQIRNAQTEAGGSTPGQAGASWGMMGYCRVLRRGQHGAFVVQTDDARLSFKYLLKDGKPYFTNVDIK